MESHCFVPGCQSGYPGGFKASLFFAPKDTELRKWERNLQRSDNPRAELSTVCENHFEPHCNLRDYVHIINGSEVRLTRGNPLLAPGAIPTLLPSCPAYLSVTTPRQRPDRKRATATNSPVQSKKPSLQPLTPPAYWSCIEAHDFPAKYLQFM